MATRTILIGGSGFIGTALSRLLRAAGHAVTVFDVAEPPQEGGRFVKGDVRDADAVARAVQGHDLIYCLAAAHRDDIRPLSLYGEVNVGGGRNVCAAATKAGIDRMAFTSSVAVYGDSPHEMTEDNPHNYINEYGRTKSLAEVEFRAWAHERPDRSLTIVRPTVVFGPGNRGNVYNLIREVATGRFVMIGDGTNRKSIAYVENVAGFLASVADLPAGERVYNYADKPDFTMNELIAFLKRELGKGGGVGLRVPAPLATLAGFGTDIAARILGRSLPVSSVRIRKFMANTRISAERALATGFTPAVSLSDGLKRMIAAEFAPAKPDR